MNLFWSPKLEYDYIKFHFGQNDFFQFGVCSISCNCLHQIPRNETQCGCYLRSNHQRCSMWKGVLWNFSKFTGKHLCESLFFNKDNLTLLRNQITQKEITAHANIPEKNEGGSKDQRKTNFVSILWKHIFFHGEFDIHFGSHVNTL